MVMLNAQNAQSEDDFAGKSRPVPGRYHAAINHAEEKGSKKKGTPGLELEFQTIIDGLAADGKTPTVNQAGKTIPLFLSYIGGDDNKTKTCLDRVTRLALCGGILRPGEAKEPNWGDAIGRELVIEIEEQNYDSQPDADGNTKVKTGSQVSFLGFWSLGNKSVANVPKDPTSPGMMVLAKAGGPVNHPTGGPAAGGNSVKPAPAPDAAIPQPPTAACGKKSKWANL